MSALTTAVYGGEGLVSAGYLERMVDTAARANDPNTEVLVAEVVDPSTDSAPELVGSVTYTRNGSTWADVAGPGEAGFRMLAVSPPARGGGVGTALIDACLARARADRCQRVAILTKDNMAAAIRRYEHLGFTRASWRDRTTPSGHRLRAYVLDLAAVTIREPAADELEEIGRLTLASYVAEGIIPADDDYAEHLLDAKSRLREATLLVAVDADGTIVGTVTFSRPGEPYAEISVPGEAEFRMLAVDQAAQGKGVGETLVHACLDLAGAAGDDFLVLSTISHTSAAARLYRRLGFESVPTRDWSPAPGIDLVVYVRPVVPALVEGR